MARLPKVGDDKGTWGDVLNDYLGQSHADDGTLRASVVGASQIAAGAVSDVHIANNSVSHTKLIGIGAANGIAPLSDDAKVVDAYLPDRLSDAGIRTTVNAALDMYGFVKKDATVWLATDHGIKDGATESNQAAAIQTAITALSAAGGGTLLFVGTFRLDGGTTITGADNVVLQGVYGARLIKSSGSSILMDWKGRKNFAIRGFDIDFGSKNYGATAGGFDGWENGIRITDCEDFDISDNVLRRGARTISLRNTSAGTNGIIGCHRGTIADNRFLGEIRDMCVDMQQPTTVNGGVQAIVVKNNYVESITKAYIAGGAWTAFYVNGGSDVRFIGNHVESSDDTAIMVNNSDHYEISGNYLRTKQLCVYAGASRWGRITNNDMSSIRDMAISLHARNQAGEPFESGSVIAQNVITDCGRNGIAIEGTQRVTITGNYAENCCIEDSSSTTITSTVKLVSTVQAGFANKVYTNTGSSTVFVGTDDSVTPSNGTAIAPAATYTQANGTSLYAVTNSNQTSTLTAFTDDNYRSAIGAWGIGSRKPKSITISGNTIIKGTSSTGLYGISIVDSPQEITVADNTVDPTFSQRFNYGGLDGRFKVQTNNGDRQSYPTTPALYSDLTDKTPSAGAFAYHPTHTFMFGDGTNWRRVADNVAVTP